MKKALAFLLVFLLMVTVLACQSQQANTTATPNQQNTQTPTTPETPVDEEIIYTIGCIFPYSNLATLAELFEIGVEGYLVYFEQEMGFQSGKNITLKIEYADHAGTAEAGMSAAERLAGHVDAMLAAYTSAAVMAIVPIAEKYQIPCMVTLSVSEMIVANPSVYCFRPSAGNSDIKESHTRMWTYLGEIWQPIKTIAVIHGSGEFWRTSSDLHAGILKDLYGTEIIYRETLTDFQTTDCTNVVRKAMEAKPDVIITMLQANEAALFQNALRELECQIPVYTGGGGYMDPAFADSIPKGGADGVLSQSSFNPDLLNYTEPAGLAWQWFNWMKEEFGKEPNECTATAWLSMGILLDAVDRAASTSGPDVAAALAATKLDTQHPANMFTYYSGGVEFAKESPGYSDNVDVRYNQNIYAACIYVQMTEGEWKLAIGYEGMEVPKENLKWPTPGYTIYD